MRSTFLVWIRACSRGQNSKLTSEEPQADPLESQFTKQGVRQATGPARRQLRLKLDKMKPKCVSTAFRRPGRQLPHFYGRRHRQHTPSVFHDCHGCCDICLTACLSIACLFTSLSVCCFTRCLFWISSLQTTQVTATASNGLITVTPSSRTFTSLTWDSTQTFTVDGVDDSVQTAESYTATVSHTASSTDGLFDGTAPMYFPSSEVRFEIYRIDDGK